jgi:hypothetical protein
MPQQFVVPQFIDVEDKILGPLTVRQFIIVLAGGITVFLAFRFGDFAMFVITLIVVGLLTLAFGFVKIRGQAFHYFLLNILGWMRNPKIRIWKKSYTNEELNFLRKRNENREKIVIEKKKPVRREKIRDLALTVNTGGFYRGDDEF